MRHFVLAALAVILTLSGCTKQTFDTGNGKGEYDPEKGALITLGSIGIGDNTTDKALSSRAISESYLPLGSTFRLYAFLKGETDFSKILATRKYSIVDNVGTPQLMKGESPLYLPLGDIDVYITGPTEADIDMGDPQYPNKRVEVATENGVFPHIGVDLISSYTAVTVRDDTENILQLNALEHKMALVEVRVTKPDVANYDNFVLNWVSIDDQAEQGSFLFNTNGGTIIPSDAGTIKLTIENIKKATEGKEYYTESYMIPRKQTNMRIGMAFQCTLEGRPVEKRLNTSLMNYALPSGNRTRFTAEPLISTELVFRRQLLPWIVEDIGGEELPTFTGYLFDYSGEDAPIEINGKRYWRDRSGNNMHAELVGDIRYNAEEKYYYQGDAKATIIIPKMPYQKNYMLEVACRTQKNSYASTLVQFNAAGITRALLIHLPYSDGKLYFDVGYNASSYNRISSALYANDPRVFENFATYAYIKSGNEKKFSLYRNGVETAAGSITTEPNVGFETNNLFTATGCIDKKVYAMRMLNNQTTINNYATIHKQNCRVDVSRFEEINMVEDPTKRSYINEGLVLNLSGKDKVLSSGKIAFPGIIEGRSATETYYYWPDLSPTKNHMVTINGTATVNASSQYWKMNNTLCKLAKPLSVQDEITVEIVATSSGSTSTTLLNFASKASLGSSPDPTRQFHLHYCWSSKVVINAPYPSPRNSIELPYASLPAPIPANDLTSKPNSVTITRKTGEKLTIYINNTQIGQTNATTKLLPLAHCYIASNGYTGNGSSPAVHQPFNGSIYAIRVYNRVLTETEREYNYEIDRMKYNILP